MTTEPRELRHGKTADAFNQHESRGDGAAVIASLTGGFLVLRDKLFDRIHRDVEKHVGMDSMLMPLPGGRAEEQAKNEIDLFNIAESAAHVRERGYVCGDEDWYRNWLGRLRFRESFSSPAITGRIDSYLKTAGSTSSRSEFATVLERVFPEARRAPLVLFRLYPLAVRLATSIAFSDGSAAEQLRERQKLILPIIADCGECRGELLENGDTCRQCGNPLWRFDWLTAE